MAVGDPDGSLKYTPTWALASVCLIFISVSVLIEHSIHLLCNWLKRHKKAALRDAVEKLKSELMLLGFISLLLAVTQDSISKICVPVNIADTMLPCRKENATETAQVQHFVNKLRLADVVFDEMLKRPYRILLADEESTPNNDGTIADSCSADGKVALITKEALHQLHIFIFVLAVMQILYSVLAMALGRAKMKRWKAWEKETQTIEYLVANDPNRFRFTRQTTFGRRHMTWSTKSSVLLWIKCFFRQFLRSVAKVDYLTLRHGFIAAHFSARHNEFNFQEYIEKSLEEDFKAVVGVSPLMWFVFVILLLVDVYGWHVYSWMSYAPMVMVLALGTKLEVIVARMALQINAQNTVIIGTPLVRPNDNFFWFGKPKFVLTLLHYTLFVNAFELAFFVWVSIQFGFNSCYHVHRVVVITKIAITIVVQVICSYITLPLYALVTQMGSEYKSNVLEEQMTGIIKQWHAGVRERRRNQEAAMQSPRWSLLIEQINSRRSIDDQPGVPSYSRPMSLPTESTQQAIGGEIMEEREENVIIEAASS